MIVTRVCDYSTLRNKTDFNIQNLQYIINAVTVHVPIIYSVDLSLENGKYVAMHLVVREHSPEEHQNGMSKSLFTFTMTSKLRCDDFICNIRSPLMGSW